MMLTQGAMIAPSGSIKDTRARAFLPTAHLKKPAPSNNKVRHFSRAWPITRRSARGSQRRTKRVLSGLTSLSFRTLRLRPMPFMYVCMYACMHAGRQAGRQAGMDGWMDGWMCVGNVGNT